MGTDPAETTGELVRASIRESAANLARLEAQAPVIEAIARRLTVVLQTGGKVMFCGNGGSAADSQHLAAELEGRFLRDRRPLPAVALTVNTSSLTAIGNDFGYEEVFSRQVRGLATAQDALVALSTSGNSANVLRALAAARDKGVVTVGLTGAAGGRMEPLCDLILQVPSDSTPRIQEMHILAGHIICDVIERAVT